MGDDIGAKASFVAPEKLPRGERIGGAVESENSIRGDAARA